MVSSAYVGAATGLVIDRYSQPKPRTIGVFAKARNDMANEQPEQAGLHCDTIETTTRQQQNPRRSRGSSGANKNRTCDLILIRDAL